MNKLLLTFLFTLILSVSASADPKFFNQKLATFIDPSSSTMTKLSLETDFMDKIEVYGIPRHYFLKNIDGFDDEFNKFNLITIYFLEDFYEAFKKNVKKYTGKNIGREFSFKLKAQNKNTFISLIDCEIKRKATMISIEKKYFDDGYRTSLTPGKLLGSTDVVDLYIDKENNKSPQYPNYKIFSRCVKISKSPIYSVEDIKDKSNFINKFFKKKDDRYIFFLEIETIKKKLILREIYKRFLDGKLTDASIEGL